MILTSSPRPERPRSSPGERIPWGRVWLLAVTIIGLLAAGEETAWRSQGFLPTIPTHSDKNLPTSVAGDLWYYWRHHPQMHSDRVLVLLGTSRMHADIDLTTMDRILPEFTHIQLAIGGSVSSLGILADLAADENFRGIVVCELYTPFLGEERMDDHRDMRDYRPADPDAWQDTIRKLWLFSRAVIGSPHYSWQNVLAAVQQYDSLGTGHLTTQTFRRETRWDFRCASVPDHEHLGNATVAQYEATYSEFHFKGRDTLLKDLERVNADVRAIQKRGGEVIFVTLPTAGGLWELGQKHHPRAEHWDVVEAHTPAICIHFQDVPGMQGFTIPDLSHLDFRDTAAFTRGLAEEIRRRLEERR